MKNGKCSESMNKPLSLFPEMQGWDILLNLGYEEWDMWKIFNRVIYGLQKI